MTKQYFGKQDTLKAIYIVAFNNSQEMCEFTKLMEIQFGIDNYTCIPEMVDSDKYFDAIGYTICDGKDKKDFEEAYKEVKSTINRWKKARTIVR